MDELSEQIRAYYDATSESARGRPGFDPAHSGITRPPVTTFVNGDEHTAEPFDVGSMPPLDTDHLEVVMPPFERPISRRRVWMLIVAAVAVPAVVLGVLVAGNKDDPPQADVPHTLPVSTLGSPLDSVSRTSDAIARRFLDAYGAWYPGEALPGLADDADISGLIGRPGDREDLVSFARWRRAGGYRQHLTDCEDRPESPVRSHVRCSFEFDLLKSDLMGLGPFAGSYYDVLIEDGEVVSASVAWELGDFSPEVWEPFADWVATEYPGDVAIMYTDETLSDAAMTWDSIRLWTQRTRDYASFRTGIDPDTGVGRHAMTVDGVSFSFEVPISGWETYDGFVLSKSTHGPQGAEAVIFWAAFPDGEKADPCVDSLWPPPASIDGIAAAVVAVPGVDLVSGPSYVTIGGHDARHIEFTVDEAVGCDPGFFYNWKSQTAGAMWVKSQLGDTIDIWIVDVDGVMLFIGGETHPDAYSGGVAEEIRQIVASIQFE
jgi:hypothetical protein